MLNSDKNWTANQIRFIYWLATPKDLRTPATQGEFAEEIGVTYVTVSRWKAKPDLTNEVNRVARAELGKDLPEVYGTLRKLAIKGSFPHMKLYLELLEEYRETSDVNVNVSESETRERHFERLFAQLDAYRAGIDGGDSRSGEGVRLDSNGTHDTPATLP